jgi:hypothetical protein
MAAVRFKVSVPQSGSLRTPQLTEGQMRGLGEMMVDTQKERWSRGINAAGQSAKPLHRVTAKGKRTFGKQPIRDMNMTGLVRRNFTLRKATPTEIRAENTSREGRRHARQAQWFEPMIGLAPQDEVAIVAHAYRAYGLYIQRAWRPSRG